jgi:outer membrane biosynthesis protein TonB
MQRIRTFWRSGWIGKIVLGIAGLFGLLMLCCVGVVAVALVVPSQPKTAVFTPGTAVQSVAMVQPTTAPLATGAPTALPTAEPTSVPPTDTPLPSPTPEPPTAMPEPTDTPIPATEPPAQVAAAPAPQAPIPTAVDVGACPCQPGQIKGNRNSGIYHAPGQRDYAKTQANVECFDTEAAAQAAGYRRAKR